MPDTSLNPEIIPEEVHPADPDQTEKSLVVVSEILPEIITVIPIEPRPIFPHVFTPLTFTHSAHELLIIELLAARDEVCHVQRVTATRSDACSWMPVFNLWVHPTFPDFISSSPLFLESTSSIFV